MADGFTNIFEKHLDRLARRLWAESVPGWEFDPEDEIRIQTEQWKEREGCSTCGHGESIRSEVHLIVGDQTLATYDDLGGLIRALDEAVPVRADGT